MNGFFSKEQVQGGVPTRSRKGVLSCASCGLYKYVLSPRMEPFGDFRRQIMVIGEAPGEEEDKKGRPWQGKMGTALRRKLKQLGVDLFEDCVSLNSVHCRPVDNRGNNRAPTDREVSCCRRRVLEAVEKYKPKVILLMGGMAVESLLGHRWRKDIGGITRWRGWTIPDRHYKAWVCPTFHPSFVERQEEGEVEVIWTRDLKQALAKVEEPLPNYPNEEDCVVVTDDIEGVLTELNDSEGLLAFDIEATGLKPYDRSVHRIVCISFCNSEDKAFAIPAPTKERHIGLLKQLLENPRIGKIAANMKYEDTWMEIVYGISVRPWVFDTMLAAHILNNGQSITGLKFQAYVRYGVLGYDEDVAPYLKSESSYKPNRVTELVKDPALFRKLRIYNGMDSLLEYRLAKDQMRELGFL